MKGKYVVLNRRQFRVVILPETMQHRDVVDQYDKPESAGFFSIESKWNPDDNEYVVKASCYGESVSLGIKSNPEEDSRMIERLFRGAF
jgi:hypothetical protein